MARRRYELREAELDRQLEALVARAAEVYGEPSDAELVRQILVSALRLIPDGTPRGDLKLINSALKELRHSFRVFAPYKLARKVAVFGSARTAPEHADWRQARVFTERLAAAGWMTITGAGDGIMGAAQAGAGRDASFGVSINLPFEQAANRVIADDQKLVNFRYFFTRKVIFVKEAHAIALFPGGFGTHDEGFEALTLIQTGKSEILPIVFVEAPGGTYWKAWLEYLRSHLLDRALISSEDLALFKVTDDVDEAVAEILGFYSNYHSSRYVGDLLVLRVRRAPDSAQLEELNAEFEDVLLRGKIEVGEALPQEAGEVDRFPRVLLHFNRREMGRLRRLIDRLNAFIREPVSPLGEASPHEIVAGELSDAEAQAEEA